MPDEMFFSNDERALVRGRRTAKRTDTFRPCLITLADGSQIEGIILNLTPHGMLIRVMGTLDIGAALEVQMMRDESFQKPLAEPRFGKVVRIDGTDGVFSDHGVRLEQVRAVDRPRPRAIVTRKPVEAPAPKPKLRGMQTMEVTKSLRDVVKKPGPRG
jgi:hypothetical protein